MLKFLIAYAFLNFGYMYFELTDDSSDTVMKIGSMLYNRTYLSYIKRTGIEIKDIIFTLAFLPYISIVVISVLTFRYLLIPVAKYVVFPIIKHIIYPLTKGILSIIIDLITKVINMKIYRGTDE